MDVATFLDAVRADPDADEALVHLRTLAAREPRLEPLPDATPDLLRQRLGMLGIEGLFPHQREGLDAIERGENVVVATGTASGKTLVYNLAFASQALADPTATALYLYPTKALARDQLRQLRSLKLPQIRAGVFDGDTPKEERRLIRSNANVVLSNPDMLHASLLPDHARWATFFLRLRLIVVDEAHVARGVFGTHVSMILRRLRRLVAHYGGDPRWVLASATIGNPAELAERLTGLPFTAVDEDRSPSGEKVFALWNPPVVDDLSGARRSALTDASQLVADLVEREIRTIAFTRSRRSAEVLAEFARQRVGARYRDRIKAYRAGYLPEERRELERALSEGDLLAVCSTSALELGIDVGSLDAAVLTGYPGTRASMWQQAGRAGRTQEGSLAVLIAHDDPLDQYLVAHPEDLFDRPPEACVIDPTNPFIVEPHLACAAREQPLTEDELAYFGPEGRAAAKRMLESGTLVLRKGLLHHPGRGAPHRELDIRSASGALFQIVIEETGELVGTADEGRALRQVHPGAIYLHQGDVFEVQELDLERRVALVQRAEATHHTQPRDITDIRIRSELETTTVGDVQTSYGEVEVTTQVIGYVALSNATGETLETVDLDLPSQTLVTKAVWWTIPAKLIGRAALTPPQVPGAAHAAEHAAIGLLPLIATCDRWDVGGVSTALHRDTNAATIFIYDAAPGGAGIAERGYRSAERLLRATRETVAACPCSEGCPACIVSPKCGNGNEPLDKTGAVALLAALLGDHWG